MGDGVGGIFFLRRVIPLSPAVWEMTADLGGTEPCLAAKVAHTVHAPSPVVVKLCFWSCTIQLQMSKLYCPLLVWSLRRKLTGLQVISVKSVVSSVCVLCFCMFTHTCARCLQRPVEVVPREQMGPFYLQTSPETTPLNRPVSTP